MTPGVSCERSPRFSPGSAARGEPNLSGPRAGRAVRALAGAGSLRSPLAGSGGLGDSECPRTGRPDMPVAEAASDSDLVCTVTLPVASCQCGHVVNGANAERSSLPVSPKHF